MTVWEIPEPPVALATCEVDVASAVVEESAVVGPEWMIVTVTELLSARVEIVTEGEFVDVTEVLEDEIEVVEDLEDEDEDLEELNVVLADVACIVVVCCWEVVAAGVVVVTCAAAVVVA